MESRTETHFFSFLGLATESLHWQSRKKKVAARLGFRLFIDIRTRLR